MIRRTGFLDFERTGRTEEQENRFSTLPNQVLQHSIPLFSNLIDFLENSASNSLNCVQNIVGTLEVFEMANLNNFGPLFA